MTDSSLTSDPFVRRTAITAAIVALVLAIAGMAAYLLTRDSADPDFTVAIGLVSPTDENRVAPGLVDCPTTEQATSPLAGSSFADSTPPAERSAFGAGQLVAYNLRVTTADGAPDNGRFVLRFSDAFEPRLRCGFLSTADPATTADGVVMTWVDASGAEAAGQIELTSMPPSESVVIQLWVELRRGEEPSRQMSLAVTAGADTVADPVTRAERASLGLPATAAGEPNLVIDDGTEAAPLGDSFTTSYTATNNTSAVLNGVNLVASIDAGATVTGARVADTTGFATTCRTRGGRLECDLGFLNPGESVTINGTVLVDASAVTFWGRDQGPCNNDDQQDLCQRATLEWAGPFSSDELETSEVTNVDDASVFSIAAEPAVETGYRLGSVTVNILVTTDLPQATLTDVSTTGCPLATYAAGDTDQGAALADAVFATDGDGVLNAGELWLLTCAARQYDEGLIEVVVAGTADGLPGRSVTTIEIEVIDPMVTMERTEGAEVTWTVTNSGDVALDSIAVSAPGCEPTRTGNGDGDTVLDVAEVWTYSCPSGAGVGRVFAIDPLGATVSGADETADS
ncbi:MAG: hypothetical protein ACR2QE_01675 [Acidimicrobiales bacterium]